VRLYITILAGPTMCQACDASRASDDAAATDAPRDAVLAGKADDPNEQEDRPLRVGSREYKLMLDPARFAGPDPTRALDALWADLKARLERDLERPFTGTLTAPDKHRIVRFLDTPGACDLRTHGLVFRERADAEDGSREVTVKFRAVDRYLAAGVDVSTPERDGRSKFEQDLGAGFSSTFSQSTKVPIRPGKRLNRLDDPLRLFPGLDGFDLDPEAPLEIVGGLTVRERTWSDVVIDLGKLDAELGVTLWSHLDDPTHPVVAEISFKYESANEDYPAKTVARGMRLFEILESLDGWVSPTAQTKTAFAYGYDPTFCH
jgi:hypothetical protein